MTERSLTTEGILQVLRLVLIICAAIFEFAGPRDAEVGCLWLALLISIWLEMFRDRTQDHTTTSRLE